MHKVGKSYKKISRTKKEQKVNKMCTNGRNPGLLLLCWGTHPTNITEGENSYQCNSFKTLDKNSANGKTTKQKLLFSGKQNKTKHREYQMCAKDLSGKCWWAKMWSFWWECMHHVWGERAMWTMWSVVEGSSWLGVKCIVVSKEKFPITHKEDTTKWLKEI